MDGSAEAEMIRPDLQGPHQGRRLQSAPWRALTPLGGYSAPRPAAGVTEVGEAAISGAA